LSKVQNLTAFRVQVILRQLARLRGETGDQSAVAEIMTIFKRRLSAILKLLYAFEQSWKSSWWSLSFCEI